MIFALLAGGFLFGFVGVLLAVPVAAVIGVLIRFFFDIYLASPLYRGGGGELSGPMIQLALGPRATARRSAARTS